MIPPKGRGWTDRPKSRVTTETQRLRGVGCRSPGLPREGEASTHVGVKTKGLNS